LEIISKNVPFPDELRGHHEAHPHVLCDGKFMTVILPEYLGVYRKGISTIMAGLVMQATAETPVDGEILKSSVFGNIGLQASMDGRDTLGFAPIVSNEFVSMLGADPAEALNNYHRLLIQQTNGVLETVASPYRLEPLE